MKSSRPRTGRVSSGKCGMGQPLVPADCTHRYIVATLSGDGLEGGGDRHLALGFEWFLKSEAVT